MIKGLQGVGSVTVGAGNTSLPFISPNINNPIQGMMRINGTEIEVFNGTGWQSLPSSYATVGLDMSTEEAINWAKRKIAEERDLEARMERHPGLRQVYEQFKIMDILTLEQDKKNEVV